MKKTTISSVSKLFMFLIILLFMSLPSAFAKKPVKPPTPECLNGEIDYFEPQIGVCEGVVRVCTDETWGLFDHSSFYEPIETMIFDGLDNDCDGIIDEKPITMSGNQVVVTGADGQVGKIAIYQYDDLSGSYQAIWSHTDDSIIDNNGGGEIGDLDGDGINEFVLSRGTTTSRNIEVWKNDEQGGWNQFSFLPISTGYPGPFVSAIRDLDNDGVNELLITNSTTNSVEAYQINEQGSLDLDATVWRCEISDNFFIKTAADLDRDGTPEVMAQCMEIRLVESRNPRKPPTTTTVPGNLIILEYDENASRPGYYVQEEIVLPQVNDTDPRNMLIDQMETGDVNGDGLEDVIFCGNSGKVHVLTYKYGVYEIEFSSPNVPGDAQFTQTCGTGDLTNDGKLDLYAISSEGIMIYTFDGNTYQEVWFSDALNSNTSIGASYAGDADNDDFTELLYATPILQGAMSIWESDEVDPDMFIHTGDLTVTATSESNVIIGKLY